MNSISSNSSLVRRVAFPREVLVFSDVAHAMVQFGIELALLSLILVAFGSPLLPVVPIVVLVSVTLAAFSSGFALALSVLSVYFKDLSYLWGIVMQIWFFVTPVVYGPDLVEEQLSSTATTLFEFNPMYHFILAYRTLLYDATLPPWPTLVVMLASATVSLSTGWAIFHRLGRRLPEEV